TNTQASSAQRQRRAKPPLSRSGTPRATSCSWFFGLTPTIHPLSPIDAANRSSQPAGRLGHVKLLEKIPHPQAVERTSTTGLKINTKSCRDCGREARLSQRRNVPGAG